MNSNLVFSQLIEKAIVPALLDRLLAQQARARDAVIAPAPIPDARVESEASA